VYHPNYLKYAERARSDLLKQIGILKSRLQAEHNLRIVVFKAEIEYLSPAFLDDELMVATSIFDISKTVITMQQDISRLSTTLAKLLVKLAVINERLRPVRWPTFLVEKLTHLNFRTE
jgi:acyl-CoA thioester hydrolase